jgi:cytochrome d ubiquinol oxidase subunit II
MNDLALIWAFVIAFAAFAYVVLDGFDLGIGILFLGIPEDENRGMAMNSVAPVWDGNETWLVLGGGGLMAAFPLAYGILMPAIYTPVIAMLIGLIFRGVAFEFRWRTKRMRRAWDIAFCGGSTLAALAQGIALGAILQGVPVAGRHYAGGWWDWLSPFSLLTGVALVAGYALLGSCWMILRTEGKLQERAFAFARWLGPVTLLGIGAVSLATPFLHYAYYRRWFAWPSVLATAQVPLLVAILSVLFALSLKRKYERAPFVLALAVFALCFMGLGISFYPFIVPPTVTLWQAAAPHASQVFTLIGTAIFIPVILAYTGYAYWIFRGKVRGGYH